MAEGFLFNHNLCVGCRACSAACIMENGWTFAPRVIYTSNSSASSFLPVINISLACNHCKKAVCLEGCPAAAYFRDPATGAVIIDDSKCIGCRYCQWNCPYDAPKYLAQQGVIGKCNFCNTKLQKGLSPACTSACPTGALAYGPTGRTSVEKQANWFPEKSLEPALKLTGSEPVPLQIFPSGRFENETDKNCDGQAEIPSEWSLVAFSFLTILSVAKNISAIISGDFPAVFQFLVIIVIAGLLSLFHLGKKERAWRAILNVKSSPLSWEIILFILYSITGTAAVTLQIPMLLIISSVTGLALLLAIDNIYIFTDNRKPVYLHSGQAFLTGLIVVSFITGMKLPFAFIAAIKLIASLFSMNINRNEKAKYSLRFIRSAVLVISGTSLISNISYPETPVLLLFLTGELIDRILFYVDFKPLNIKSLININTTGLKV
jgi:Fe-S-cluster-containing dehydrogenase component/DMSO reductase anchor subunit